MRIAGIEVGKVKKVESMGDGSGLAKVTMEIEKSGLPIKRDAQLKVRSRLFLEGNYFVDLQPGTPSGARARAEGGTIPPSQTAFPVQFGQVLTALQSDTREDLQILFRELATGYSGDGPGRASASWLALPGAAPTGRPSLVNQALLGRERHDLSRLLDGQAKVFGALSRDEDALANLVTDLNTTIGALASEDENLRLTIPALRDVLRVGRPALASLDCVAAVDPRVRARRAAGRAHVAWRRWTRRSRSSGRRAGSCPRTRRRGLVRDLRPTDPGARPAQPQLDADVRADARAGVVPEQRAAAVRADADPRPGVPEPHSGEPYFEEAPRAFVGLAGESRLADANSAFFRVLAGTGPTTVFSTGDTGERLFGQLPQPLAGTRPPRPPRAPVFRPNVPCETQEPPDLNSPAGPGDSTARPSSAVGTGLGPAEGPRASGARCSRRSS